MRAELKSIFHFEDIYDRFESGFKAVHPFFNHLSATDQKEIQNDWIQGLHNVQNSFEKKNEKNEGQQEGIPLLEDMLGFSEKTMDFFFKSGLQLIHQNEYQKACDVFLILAMLNVGRHDVWMSLGICEQRLHHYEAASHAFSMAAVADASSPYPYAALAECCLEMSNSKEALVYLDMASENLTHSDDTETKKLIGYIEHLKKQCNK